MTRRISNVSSGSGGWGDSIQISSCRPRSAQSARHTLGRSKCSGAVVSRVPDFGIANESHLNNHDLRHQGDRIEPGCQFTLAARIWWRQPKLVSAKLVPRWACSRRLPIDRFDIVRCKIEAAFGSRKVSKSRCAIGQPAQQESLATSRSNVCAASFNPSTVVR